MGSLYSFSADTSAVTDNSYTAEEDTIVDLHFPELTVSIIGLIVDDEATALKGLSTDTVSLYCSLGWDVEGKEIHIEAPDMDHVELWQSYETSMSISGEGPHCDLLDWKHFYSERKPIKKTNNDHFLIATYTDAERTNFPDVSLEDLKNYAKEACGESWYESVNNIHSIHEYPAAILISRYYITISGIMKGSEKKIQKVIAIDFPMGC